MQITMHNKNMKRICFVILLVIWALSVMSASPNTFPGDSVGLKKQNGNSYIIYKVSSGETVYAVARKYEIPFASIAAANPGVNMSEVKAGQTILVPSAFSVQQNFQSEASASSGTHTVSAGETLYSIAREYSISYDRLMELNPALKNSNIQPGQKLYVEERKQNADAEVKQPVVVAQNNGQTNKEEAELTTSASQTSGVQNTEIIVNEPDPAKQDIASDEKEATGINTQQNNSLPEVQDIQSSTLPVTDKNKPFSTTFAEYDYTTGLTSTSEKGVATWIDGSNDLSTTNDRYYALHNNAPIGSVIKIRNLMNNRTIYAKVIGTLSEDEINEKVMVKLSAGAAQKLNVLDNRFVVEATFFTEKNVSTTQK